MENKRMLRIAVGCEDGKVPRKHFGDCPEFRVYELCEDGTYKLIETRPNASPAERQHADPNKLKGVLGELSGCEVVISGLLSPNFIRMRDTKPVQPVVTKLNKIPALMQALHAEFEKLFPLVLARRRGEHPQEIPILE